MTKDDLIAFEAEMAAAFNAGKIAAPCHLAGGNEDQLIDIFRGIRKDDWVLGSWRAHFHCLLKGVPREQVRDAILSGRSIALTFPKHRVLCSAIVGGIAPIAVGIAMGIKRNGGSERVYCFIGDMTATTGIVHECMKYAACHALPVKFIIEDNGMSVCSDTRETWGMPKGGRAPAADVFRYYYTLPVPHVGTGKWVSF